MIKRNNFLYYDTFKLKRKDYLQVHVHMKDTLSRIRLIEWKGINFFKKKHHCSVSTIISFLPVCFQANYIFYFNFKIHNSSSLILSFGLLFI